MLNVCKSIEKRLWSFDHALCQFDLPENILSQIRNKNPTMDRLLDMDPEELGELVHNKKMGHKIFSLFKLLSTS